MKKIIENYTFDAALKTLRLDDYSVIQLHRLLLVTNITDSIVIYNFATPATGGTADGNTLTFTYDTTSMSGTDRLLVIYDEPADARQVLPQSVSDDTVASLLRHVIELLENFMEDA